MKTYKIIVAYDGTDYCGWQIQLQHPSVAEKLQKSWEGIFNQPIKIIGASRTDTGVHALGQVAKFSASIPTKLDIEQTRIIWNKHLPSSILIRHMTEAAPNFHPCFHVKQKTYWFTIFLRKPLPLIARYGWHYRLVDDVDLATFQRCLNLYKGTHDFGSFCKIEEDHVKTIRTIDDLSVTYLKHYHALVVSIKSAGFARFQIRRMIGYALDVSRNPKTALDCLRSIINNPNPQQTLTKADACGLCLRKVVYHNGNE